MVHEKLKRGKENAITSAELMKLCGFNDKRTLQMQISKERAEGAIICSTTVGQGGYYLPQDKEEVQEFIKSMTSRARKTFKAIKSARKYMKIIDGQMSLEEQGAQNGEAK